MPKCYVCENEITKDNVSEEHILINAIGGKLKSKELICKKCNSFFGDKIDAELANQMNVFSNLLNIKRDRYSPRNIEVKYKKTGDTILIKSGGKPIRKLPKVEEKLDENNKGTINVKTATIKEAKKTLKGLKRKYSNIDVDNVLYNVTKSSEYLSEGCEYKFKIGGDKVFKSICKTAINFYMINNGDRKYIEHLLLYINGQKDINCINYYYRDLSIIPKEGEEIVHSIIVKGNNSEKILLAYVELFSCFRFIIILNDNYDGIDIDSAYYFDVLTGLELQKTNNFNVDVKQLNELMKYSYKDKESLLDEINKLLNYAEKKQKLDYIEQSTKEAMENSLGKYSEDVIITEDMLDEFINECIKRVVPILKK